MFDVGDIVSIADKIDPDIKTIATIKYIEPDDEFPNLNWLYLIANEEVLNDTDIHPVIGPYWRIIEDCSPCITLLSKAVL